MRPRRASGAALCNSMLIPTLHTEIPKPTPNIPSKASASQSLAANNSSENAAIAVPATTAPTTAGKALRVANTMVEAKAPQPAAPHNQPSVVASPWKTSAAKTGSSTA